VTHTYSNPEVPTPYSVCWQLELPTWVTAMNVQFGAF